ncbi:MAG TPA: sensor histidine kinase [Myxococcota bacterium]|nr:sensor histidine kinase [Myxococcota bacterium]
MSDSASRSRRWKWALSFALVLPPAALLALAVPRAAHRGSVREISCWVLPNLRVMATPGNEACPIGSRQAIARADQGELVPIRDHADLHAAVSQAGPQLRLELQEGARRRWLDVPVRGSSRANRLARVAAVAAGVSFLLGIPILLVWRSSSRAAGALAGFYACVSAVLVTTVVGQHSLGMTRAALVALVLAPAAAMHLSLRFPEERPVARQVPALAALPYALGALLVPIGWVSLERDPVLWPAFASMLIALTAAAWAALALSCRQALRESVYALERARARLVLYGAVLLPLLPTAVLARQSHEIGHVTTSYLWSAAVTMPLPIALAIGRHNLFDLEWDARRAIARSLYLTLAALVVAALLLVALLAADTRPSLREPAPLTLVAIACVAAVDLVRGRSLGALDALVSPQLARWRRLRDELGRALAVPRGEDEIARLLADALRSGLALRGACVLVADAAAWRVAQMDRLPSAGADAADLALRVLGAGSLAHLAETSPEHEQAAALIARGVEAVVAIESSGARYGLLLLGSLQRRRPLSGVELDFACALAAQAAIALRNARLTAELVAAERDAEAGRVALGLAHDVGKDLGWMRSLVKRLPERLADPQQLCRDAAAIGELTDGLAEAIERFVREATAGMTARGAARRLDALADDAANRAERLHGCGRVARDVAPDVRGLRVHESLGRALGNLLDNALLASPEDAPVRLAVRCEAGVLVIDVEDQGCGISELALARVFEPGFTTRAASGGSGVGLAVAQEIVETCGGALELRSSGRGTRASIRLPIAE